MLTVSIVLYNTPFSQINTMVKILSNSNCIDRVFIIDNSPTENNKIFFDNCEISTKMEYIPHENTGYGSSHNIAISKAIELGSDYHVVLNPDVYFKEDVLPEIKKYMDCNPDISYLLPKVIYPDGDLQYLCKLLPSPADLFFRRFLPITKLFTKLNNRYELRMSDYDSIMNPPCLSGCFMFLRCSTLKEYNLFFDDRFFMYFEDFDLIRRIHKVAKTVYYPKVTIIHDHAKESYKNKKMLKIHIKSAIRYFNKWGWLFDKERRQMNKQIIKEIEEMNCKKNTN